MDCKVAEEMVNDYIDDKLEPKELENFIKHVHSCPSCYEELETYFIIRVAMNYLDHGEVHSYNIKEMVEHDMHTKEQSVKRYKRNHVILVCTGVLCLIIIALMILFEWNPDVYQDMMEYFQESNLFADFKN